MANRAKDFEDRSSGSRALSEKEIKDLFEALNLSTAAEREKFLRLDRLSNEPDSGQDHMEALRVRFSNSTAREPAAK
jgi:hypothetical protein